ncbi:MAG: hypothetical protein HQ527_08375 [Cyanobacteria bacterium]|nr:hypothetical protein [Cyanobacteria bacterium bin.51]
MGTLPDRTVILLLAATLGLVFAMVFWFARLNGPLEPPLLWKEAPGLEAPPQRTPKPQGTLL